jgi:energy-coupling factor transport system permease protein
LDIYLYLDAETIVHRVDPRVKLTILLVSFALAFVSFHPAYLASLMALILLYGALGKSLSNLRRIWFVLAMVGFMAVVLWAVFAPGRTPLFWRITAESLSFGIATALRVDAMIIAGMIFLSTTRNEEITAALLRFRLPFPAAFAFSTALRLVPTFAGAGATIIQAQKSRGLDLESGNILERTRKYVPLLVPVLLTALRGTDLMAMALESKGFGAQKERTMYLQLQMKLLDWTFLGVTLLVLAVSVAFVPRFLATAG